MRDDGSIRDKTAFFALSMLLLAAMSAAAQAPPDRTESRVHFIEEIRVVAARTPRAVRDVAGSVAVVSGDAIASDLALGLADALARTPGVSATGAGTRFGDDGFRIRGLGGNRVVSLVDGVPDADAFAVGAFSNAGKDWLVPDAVDRIEILRGPASTLFGSDALAGVVATVTRDPQDYLGAGDLGLSTTFGRSGADDSTVGGLAVAARAGATQGVVHLHRREGHARDASASSVVDERDRDRIAGMLKLVHDLGAGDRLRLAAHHFDETVESDLVSVLGTGRRYRDTTSLRGDDGRERTALVLGADLSNAGGFIDRLSFDLYGQRTQVDQHTAEQRGRAAPPVAIERRFEYEVESAGANLDLESSFDLGAAHHRIGWGLQLQTSTIRESRDGVLIDPVTGARTPVLLGERLPTRDFPRSRIVEIGAWLHDEIRRGPLTLIPALRLEYLDLDARDDDVYGADGSGLPVVDVRETQLVPRLGLLWRTGPRTTLFAQVAAGFRSPPFADVNVGLDLPAFAIRAIPNPELKPERSLGVELGVRTAGARWDLTFAAFSARYEDFITPRVEIGVDAATGLRLFQSRNLGEARIHGLELAASRTFGSTFTADLAASWAQGRDESAGAALVGVDPMELVARFHYTPADRVRLTATGTFAAAADRTGPVRDAFEAPAHGVLDLTLGLVGPRGVTIDAGLFNVFDATFWRAATVGTRAANDPSIPLLSEPGRHLRVTVRAALGTGARR